jgi:hypothetical protein
MRKMRDDSTWNRLTPEQRETLESWLFDENLGYAKTLERVQKEFGVEATIASGRSKSWWRPRQLPVN